jgi:hypothetical protein
METNNFNTNILDYMYEGWGFDMDNQLLYEDPEVYNEEALNDNSIADFGLETLAHQGIVGHDPALEVDKANEYKEVQQFVSENGANYTDLRQRICACH